MVGTHACIVPNKNHEILPVLSIIQRGSVQKYIYNRIIRSGSRGEANDCCLHWYLEQDHILHMRLQYAGRNMRKPIHFVGSKSGIFEGQVVGSNRYSMKMVIARKSGGVPNR